MRDLLEKCRERIGPPPRAFGPEENAHFSIHVPLWYRLLTRTPMLDDRLLSVLKVQKNVRDRGRVVWGFVIFANNLLFEASNRRTVPASLLYSMVAEIDGQPDLLQKVNDELASSEEPEMARLFSELNAGEKRIMRAHIPQKSVPKHDFLVTTCWVQPSHLPMGYLTTKLLPILVLPEETQAAFILPSQFWPDKLRRLSFPEDKS